jgi:hypothetical protein
MFKINSVGLPFKKTEQKRVYGGKEKIIEIGVEGLAE